MASGSSRAHLRKWMRNYARALFDGDDCVDGHIGQAVYMAARPGDDKRIDFGSLAKTEVNARIACGHVAGSAFRLIDAHEVSGCELEDRADAVSIGFCAYEQDFKPVIGCGSIVAEQFGRIAAADHGEPHSSAVEEIGSCEATARNWMDEVGAELVGYFFEVALAQVAEHKQRLLVTDQAVIEVDVVDHRTVRLDDVGPAVVVVVDELGGYTAEEHGLVADAGAVCRVGERAVAVYVGRIDAHARLVPAVLAGGEAGEERDVGEGPVVVVLKEEVGPGVVGDRDVGPTVVVEVGENDSHALRFGKAHSGLDTYVGESPVVIVAIELGLQAMIVVGIAVGAIAGRALSAIQIIFGVPVDVVGYNEIEPAIFVEVEPSGGGGPLPFVGNAGFGADIGKCPVAVVVVEDGAAVARDVEIGIAIIVKVAHCDALAIMALSAHMGFVGYIRKCPVAVVVIES